MTQPAVLTTNQSFKLDFFIPTSTWFGLYDRLEVWRSRTTAGGPYEALHGNTWTPATLPQGAPTVPPSPSQTGSYVSVVGLDLQLLVQEVTPVSIVFTGTNPLTLAQVATQIAAQSNGLLSSFVINGQVVVQTIRFGEIAVLRCTGGAAAPLLGFSTVDPSNVAFGLDARVVLTNPNEQYSIVDANGSASYWYRTRFYNSTTGLFSDYSLPVQAGTSAGISQANLVRCYVDLVDLTGNAIQNAEVLIFNAFNGLSLESKNVVGGSVKLLTDVNGHAEILLPRGAQVSVTIGGTDLSRNVTVPTDTTIQSINLLDPSIGSDDLFTAQKQNIAYAVRRSI
jgi:hypothetical protein